MPHQVINASKSTVGAAAAAAAASSADAIAEKAPVVNGVAARRPQQQKKSADELERERVDRESLVMWRRPIDTLVFAGKEALTRILDLKQ